MEGVIKGTIFNQVTSGEFCFSEFTVTFSTLGLRKLEAFFGFLITVMALTFGYEASISGYLQLLKTNIFFCSLFKRKYNAVIV